MRKVFLSTMLLGEMNNAGYASDDFELGNKKYKYALTYLVDSDVKENDNVMIATVVQKEEGGANKSHRNLEEYKNEIRKVLAERNVNLHFLDMETTKEFTSKTFHLFFKEIAGIFKDDDTLYMDITFGMKPYSFAMFIAASYAIKASMKADVGAVIYAQKFVGNVETEINCVAKIYDLTGLFYLNELAGSAKPGEKNQIDKMLDFIIRN